ncbi:hypothetical protein XENOCAPTIV_029008 [Xenoophorus captivus]|uniref:Uncharacterized protein n=1 Tax=Xenoophorus captivus TaxID=1517983 RepID=A0ABV0RME7_9TELE
MMASNMGSRRLRRWRVSTLPHHHHQLDAHKSSNMHLLKLNPIFFKTYLCLSAGGELFTPASPADLQLQLQVVQAPQLPSSQPRCLNVNVSVYYLGPKPPEPEPLVRGAELQT